MGTAGVKIKIMPSSPSADLKKIEKQAEAVITKNSGKNCRFEIEPIAFGLNALIAIFAWPEEKELEELENKLGKIKEVNSVQTIDIRKTFG